MKFRLLVALLAVAFLLTGQTKKIVVLGQSDEVVRDWQSASDKVKLVRVDREQVMSEIGDAHAFLGSIRPEWVRAGKKLEWTQTTSAGVERVLHLSGSNDLRDSDIILTNNQVVQGPEIADHAMAMLLALTREIPKWLKHKDDENWNGRERNLFELNTKTAVVIGVGGIGRQISIRAWAHGMKVIGVDPEDMPFVPYMERVVKPDQLDKVIGLADVVFMAAPHTPKSHKMVGPAQFEMMKKGSYFIAVSRGGTYDLNALVKALDSKRLAGSGVDVTDPEPLPKGHALWQFDNAIITPHIAGRSDLDRARMLGTVKENIRRFAEGLPLLNVVDKHKGY
jgi:phosphoglycerate dehydrogenase-like enzyme